MTRLRGVGCWSCFVAVLPTPFALPKRFTAMHALHVTRGNRRHPSFVGSGRFLPNSRTFHGHTPLRLNRILFETSEIDKASIDSHDKKALATVTLSKDDYRTIHVAKILRLKNGDSLRVGTVRSPASMNEEKENKLAGLVTDDATITWLPEGKIKKAQPTKNGDPPGSLKISLWNNRNAADTVANNGHSTLPPVSLLLALPRPLQLGRVLPMISQLGVDQLILTNAKKVPKDYFGSHILRNTDRLHGLLVEGLAQSGDVTLPNVTVAKQLKIFMEDEFDEMFPPEEVARVVAHPQRTGKEVADEMKRMTEVAFPAGQPRRIVVAVGPEGGWEEPYELDMFFNKGFQQITLGSRVLRSDVAVVSLLALAHEVCTAESS